MHTRLDELRTSCARILIVATLMGSVLTILPRFARVQAQRPIVVTADQPDIWTLETGPLLDGPNKSKPKTPKLITCGRP